VDHPTVNITPFQSADFERVVRFIARMNDDPMHHIGYFGVGAADVEQELQSLDVPLPDGFKLAVEGGDLIGVMGVDFDPEISRAWLYGPVIDHVDWHSLADQLYAAVRPAIPPTIGQHELFCDAHNLNCRAFAERHGFAPISEHMIFFLHRSGSIPAAAVSEWEPPYFEAFQGLHNRAFPNAYYKARQIVDKQGDDARLLIAAQNGDLQGHVFGQVTPHSGYIDFIAVNECWRGQGIGKTLLAGALHWMFSIPAVEQVNLTVAVANTAAQRLYESFGFTRERTMCAFRT
jgi:ribosomal protein S18 acetylase RimI-like enzyme